MGKDKRENGCDLKTVDSFRYAGKRGAGGTLKEKV